MKRLLQNLCPTCLGQPAAFAEELGQCGDCMADEFCKPKTNLENELVTIETLDLLSKTLAYLNRLPSVPITRELCKAIYEHLENPKTLAVARAARAAELIASTRIAQCYSPAGELSIEVIARGDCVSYRFPTINLKTDQKKFRRMRAGVTLKLRAFDPDYDSTAWCEAES